MQDQFATGSELGLKKHCQPVRNWYENHFVNHVTLVLQLVRNWSEELCSDQFWTSCKTSYYMVYVLDFIPVPHWFAIFGKTKFRTSCKLVLRVVYVPVFEPVCHWFTIVIPTSFKPDIDWFLHGLCTGFATSDQTAFKLVLPLVCIPVCALVYNWFSHWLQDFLSELVLKPIWNRFGLVGIS